MPTPAALFDMDRTLLRVNSGTEWVRWSRRRGEMSAWKALRALGWIARYKLAILDLEEVARIAIADVRGDDEAEMISRCEAFFEEQCVPEIAPAGIEAIERHRRDGHVLAILTSSTPYVAQPLARRLGVPHVICTRLNVEGGRFLGTHVTPACAGAGKVHWAERFAAEHDVDLGASFFYTDSYSDLPMLLRVGAPRVINPDPRLRRHALRAGWSSQTW